MGEEKELTVLLEQYQQEALVRGRAGLELTEGRERRKIGPWCPLPTCPGLVSASCPSRP